MKLKAFQQLSKKVHEKFTSTIKRITITKATLKKNVHIYYELTIKF